ncbi:hypothetical protein AAC387_Pa04g2994 [Persea americana]
MGLRTMVSPTRGQAPHFPPLTRQGSLYNLTLDEVQNQLGDLGKPLNSMNLDELLKTVIGVDENYLPATSSATTASSSSTPLLLGNLNLSRTVSRKTVDEVWSEIVQHEQEENAGGGDGDGDGDGDGSLQKQPTLGEMTLEDFLIRAGAINLANQDFITINSHQLMVPDSMAAQRPEWMQYHQIATTHQQEMAVLGSGLPVAPPVFGNSSVDVGYHGNQLALTMPVPLVGSALSDLQSTAERKRQFSDEMMEKTIERRQKRMIKNRESAARSRARKQAYTNQLEQEVSRLRKTNWRLKQQRELEMLLPLNRYPCPKHQLRRTSSAPF